MSTWNIVINSNDCDWLFIDMPEAIKSGRVERICLHPENESRFCAEETCPKKNENKREYHKYEFCRAVGCIGNAPTNKCNVDPGMCIHTAKEFHHWLNDNGFEIRKKAEE
jgi:hypothetical protein